MGSGRSPRPPSLQGLHEALQVCRDELIERLQHVQRDPSVPQEVRNALGTVAADTLEGLRRLQGTTVIAAYESGQLEFTDRDRVEVGPT